MVGFGVVFSAGGTVNYGSRFPFETILTNEGGGYDFQLHHFQCAKAHYYLFSMGQLSNEASSDVAIFMEGEVVVGR